MNNNFIIGILKFLMLGLLCCLIIMAIDAFANTDLQKIKNTAAEYIDEQISKIETKEDLSTPQIIEAPISDVADTFTEEVNYKSSATKTRYFYSQLDEASQTIYDGILSNIENMKTGTAKVEFGNKFSNILAKENGQEELGKYYQSAIEAFTYDNPDVFFLDPTKMYLNIQTTTRGSKKTFNVYITSSEGQTYLANGFNSAEQINQYQAQMEQIKNSVVAQVANSSTEKKIKHIHDYLVENLEYDQTLSKANIHNIYGALINNECVCEGYAKAFKYMLDEAGVSNVIAVGIGTNSAGGTENHAWNYVEISGNWYAVDVTWDDPIVQGGGIILPSLYKNKYYLKGSATMQADHIPNGQFSDGGKTFTYPPISTSDY